MRFQCSSQITSLAHQTCRAESFTNQNTMPVKIVGYVKSKIEVKVKVVNSIAKKKVKVIRFKSDKNRVAKVERMIMILIVRFANYFCLKSGENRVKAVERLARHAEIVVVHDTQQQTYGWPTDWEQSKNSENPIWGGR